MLEVLSNGLADLSVTMAERRLAREYAAGQVSLRSFAIRSRPFRQDRTELSSMAPDAGSETGL